ncbi:hypothetical protein [Variovorax boronicumulans]|uniref:hypothetical protein n=1 Tax=Variovorax boronicumulans TaxID=436515 RepID=UPI0007843612|nr:hypothetical protein [Variovorax boronicumulans]
MADQIIAGQTMPDSLRATCPDAADLLEKKLTQLRSLLSCCYGEEQELFEAIGAKHRGNIMWIAVDLATEAEELSQVLLKGIAALDGPSRPEIG